MQLQEKRLLLQGWEMKVSDQAAVGEQGLEQMLSFKSWTKMGIQQRGWEVAPQRLSATLLCLLMWAWEELYI